MKITISFSFEEIQPFAGGQSKEQVKAFIQDNAQDMVISYLINMSDEDECPSPDDEDE
jgi:hypothetical protein